MSLYHKYRPDVWENVNAQDEAVNFLKNIVTLSKDGKAIPHAYIFAGGHGIGKTTLARIFARELLTDSSDIYELDAASTSRKIEDMRDMIERVYTLPMNSKYKVYILDEAHALTKDSSNAFLKTLEEPPAHVIFILCTTDPDKILKTIKSRCNILNLKKPSQSEIKLLLSGIIKSEKIKNIEDGALDIIAKSSNRSFRDAVTNLEKFLHSFEERSIINAELMFGSNSNSLYTELVSILDSDKSLNINNLIKYISKNYTVFSYDNFISHVREEIIKSQSLDTKTKDSNVIGNQENNFYNFKNLLYLLEKENIYNNTNDKFSALLAIFGNMR